MLHVTNGDSAATVLTNLGVVGDVLPWRDVLHEGPVPGHLDDRQLAGVRAEFLAGYASSVSRINRDLIDRDQRLARAIEEDEEIVLWFEHDLYDQLQLLQIVERISRRPECWSRTYLAQGDEFLAMMPEAALQQLAESKRLLDRAQIETGRSVWQAFAGRDVAALNRRVDGSLPFPHLGTAIRRLAEEFPSTNHGLSRTEAQALEALANGAQTAAEAFRAGQEVEEAVFLGDSVFAAILARLSSPGARQGVHGVESVQENALLTTVDGRSFEAPGSEGDRSAWQQELRLTNAGRRLLDGDGDFVTTYGIDRWIGGFHLQGRSGVPRWDPALGRLVDL